ncbi:Mucin-associated surface protein (MASP) [Trypanosoma cruzi]|uniref:Mucin-associated surface protein (MASP), putative n=2 Tax=Trypanosoma cruzi TaxID=5693 RepID=Q4CY29_TRYCC|nr:mucin-associated surface protein (MASP), putative [Trypanosoma cruzi]EAN85180.1 mucin-associated surface protein (MASP), putative [Trypanosoma cruzi]PWV20689.1 Mucin-associated surface protein (MASP) [Trypanosoma cruzi]|eukprot:XP_807031.1 mucin-associated surface protein (MASP) [Trypanosoma cruzi strain CL Brener]
MAMMMTGRVLLVCALCVLWCGAGGVYARNPDSNSLGGHMASRGFGRNTSFLSNGSIKNLSTPLLLSASFISAMQAEAREEVSSPGVTNLPLSGATVLSPAFSGLGASSPRPTVPGHGTPIPGAAFPGTSGAGPIPDVAVPSPGPSVLPGHVPAITGPTSHGPGAAAFSGLGAAIPGAADPGAAIPGAIPGPGSVRGAAVHGHVPAITGRTGAGPGHAAGPAPGPGSVRGPGAIPGAAAFSGLGAAGPGAAGPGPLRDPAFPGPDANIPVSVLPGHGTPITGAAGPGAAAFSGPGAAIPGAIPGPGSVRGPALSGLVPAVPGAGHSVGGGSELPDSRSVVTSSSQGGNGKIAPVSVSSDEQIASPEEVLAQKETGSQGTSSPEGQPTVSSNTEKQRNNSASAGGHSLGHDAAGDELQDSLEEQQKNDHSQTNETKKSPGDQNTESQSSGGALSEVSNTTTHGIKTQEPKTNSVNEKNYSQNTDASHTTSPLLLLLVVACAAAAAVVAA